MNKEQLLQYVLLMNKIREHKMLFDYHIALVNSGQSKNRKLFHGTNGPEFTNDEKIKDTLDIALRHISLVRECSEKLVEILKNSDNNSDVENLFANLNVSSEIIKH